MELAASVTEDARLDSELATEPVADARLEVMEAATLLNDDVAEETSEAMELRRVLPNASSLLVLIAAGRSWAFAKAAIAAKRR